MKIKKQTLFIFFIGFTTSILSQNAFYDASYLIEQKREVYAFRDTLVKYLNRKGADSLKLISKEERSKCENFLKNLNQIQEFYRNPYAPSVAAPNTAQLKRMLTAKTEMITRLNLFSKNIDPNSVPKEYNVTTGTLRNTGGASLTEIPSSSLLSASTIIDGTARFLKKRIKEELKTAFLTRFKDKMGDDPLFQRLLPSTFQTLTSVLDMDNSLPSLNNIAINSFQADMEQLPEHLEAFMLYDASFEEIRHTSNFKYFALPFNFIKHFQAGSHPAFALKDMQEKYYTDTTELDKIMQMMVVLDDNLRAKDTDWSTNNGTDDPNTEGDNEVRGFGGVSKSVFVTADDWNTLRRKGGDSLFMSIIYRKFGQSLFSKIKKDSVAQVRTSMKILSDNISDYVTNLGAFESYHFKIKDEENRRNRDSFALELAWNVMQLIDKSHLIYFSILEKSAQETYKQTYWKQHKPIAEATLKAAGSLQRKNYAGLVLNTFQILRGLSDIPSFRNRHIMDNAFLENFFFYSNFMTDVLSASTSEDVSDILERYAAPVGSYGVKRKAKFSISLNAFPGLFGAVESPFGNSSYVGVNPSSFVSGVTAPIGLSFNWGGYGLKNNKNWSLFASIIDIGAVLSYRWTDDAAEGLPTKVEWAQVISPGLHLVYGFPDLPLSMAFGYQISPRLRKVDIGGNNLQNRTFQRFSLSFMVDITILNFYKTSRRK